MEWRALATLALEIWMDAAANGRAGRLALQIATRHYMPDLLTIARLRRTCRYVRELWTHRLPSRFDEENNWVIRPLWVLEPPGRLHDEDD